MGREPLEVEVLDEEGVPIRSQGRRLSLLNPIHALAFVFAGLTALMILLMALAAALLKASDDLDEETPPE